MNNEKIDGFFNEYRFLSNFHKSIIVYDGIKYPTLEHAYQAAKTDNVALRKAIAMLPEPKDARQAGQGIALKKDWEKKKVGVMRELVYSKFRWSPYLESLLLKTGDMELIEGNTWGDKFWGVDSKTGKGENNLGKILMEVRKTLKEELEIVKGHVQGNPL